MGREILCVDDDDGITDITGAIEAEESLTAIEATSTERATSRIEAGSVDCVVTDYDLPDGSGMEVLDRLRTDQPQTPCVLFTEATPGEIDTESFGDQIVEYLNRDLPDADERLAFVVDDLIAHSAQVGFLAPDDEHSRLDALAQYDVEELPIEASFDRLSELVASHFDVAVAFVGLIESDVENMVACHGADWDELTREKTICTHSMLQEDVMVVEDISEDTRFAENDTLRNLGIVSYAGANMTTDGQVIGQLCLIDHEPRRFDEAERRELELFASTAMEILELRQTVRDAREQEAEA